MAREEVTLISDPKVLSIPIQENGDSLIDLLSIPELFVDSSRDNVQKLSLSISFVRKTVANLLLETQKKLPDNYRLMIKECHRDIKTQG